MSDLLTQALQAMNSSGLTSNVFTQENKQPIAEVPSTEEPQVVAIDNQET